MNIKLYLITVLLLSTFAVSVGLAETPRKVIEHNNLPECNASMQGQDVCDGTFGKRLICVKNKETEEYFWTRLAVTVFKMLGTDESLGEVYIDCDPADGKLIYPILKIPSSQMKELRQWLDDKDQVIIKWHREGGKQQYEKDGKLPKFPGPPEQLEQSLCLMYGIRRFCTEAGLLFQCVSGRLYRGIGGGSSDYCDPETGKVVKGKSLQELFGQE